MNDIDFTLLAPRLEKHKGEAGSLIAVLQEAQELYGWLSPELLAHVAEETGIPPAKVMGVATFYAQFRLKPVGKNLILLCQGTACHVNGSAEIEKAVRDYLGVEEGEITPDGLFTYNSVACLGCCSLSPVMMINSKAYGNLTGAKTVEVLEKIKSGVDAK
ncbi:MAG: NADH-quinone oxidoreductase subunit NuoE [Oscillospiraceae bacterium]|jgi:NADH-quinone oxidoreductase subunit E|nr:NADH-quinone oxidoreductase subunit NuoE [Oscillospiraceae bacterium]